MGAAFDATTQVPVPALPSDSLDSSPSLAAGTSGTWLAWARSPVEPNATQSAIVVARVDPNTGPQPGPPSLMLATGALANVSLAYEGSRFLAVYAVGTDATPPGTNVFLWPIAPATDPASNLLVTTAPGRALSLDTASRSRNDGIPFVLGYFESARGTVTLAGVFASNATYTAGLAVHPTPDTTHFGGRAARSGLDSLFALTGDSTGATLRDQTGAMWATVPSAIHVAADLRVRATDVVVAAAAGPGSVHLSAIDRAPPHAVSPAWPADVSVSAGSLGEIALAEDLRGGEWLVTMAFDAVAGVVLDVTAAGGAMHATDATGAFAGCSHLRAAPFVADPDALAITAQCSVHTLDPGHIVVWIVRRDPPMGPDAGVDAGPDVALDAIEDVTFGPDAGDERGPTEADASVTPRTGPGFRGSGCACDMTRGARSGSLPVAMLALGLAMSIARTGRRRQS